ncbi:uncharacterized protein LOC110842396 isoform X2 [Folsomia candida]|uniref:uncharacterized protein LOC110842396 isoform X2 n=1 Tax=Folsomia candida TaxID=158441 RepID=UPI000B8F655C|nr:uncharacterized protein LOC110842396 isoform X2 [Folsomia candida]
MSEQKALEISRPNSPAATEQLSSLLEATTSTHKSSSHRSRKEKLVVRSFSTESNESDKELMEPHILTREEFLREKKKKYKTESDSPIPNNGSRDSSPPSSPPKVKSPETLLTANILGESFPSPKKENLCNNEDEGGTGSPEKSKTKSRPRKYKKKTNSGFNMKEKSSSSTRTKKSKLPKPEKRPKVDRKLKRILSLKSEKTSTSIASSAKKLSKKRLPKVLKFPAEEVKQSSSPNTEICSPLNSSTAGPSSSPSFSASSSSSPFLIKSPRCAMSFALPKPATVSSCSSVAYPPATKRRSIFTHETIRVLPELQSKLVKYSVLNERLRKFSKVPLFTLPQPILRKKKSSLSPKKLLRKSSFVTKKSDSANTQQANSPKNNIAPRCLSNPDMLQDISCELDALTLSRGIGMLQDLVKNISPNQMKMEGVTIPQICAEAVAKLGKVASEFPTSSDDEEDENEENIEHPYVHHAKNLIRNKGTIKELKVLMEAKTNLDAAGGEDRNVHSPSFNPLFPAGSSFMRQTPFPRLPRIRTEELEVLKELLTPDDDFDLREDEIETIKLYIELIRSELNAFKEDQKHMSRTTSMLKNPENQSDLVNQRRKIVDAYMIPVKFSSAEQRLRVRAALPGVILSKEEVADKVLKSQSDSLQELKTQKLRNGKSVPFDSRLIDLSNKDAAIIKNKTPSTNPKKTETQTYPLTFPPPHQMEVTADSTIINEEPVTRLRDGKELRHDRKPLDIFREEPCFKVEVKPELFESEIRHWNADRIHDDYSKRVDANMKRLRDGRYEYEYGQGSKMTSSAQGRAVTDDDGKDLKSLKGNASLTCTVTSDKCMIQSLPSINASSSSSSSSISYHPHSVVSTPPPLLPQSAQEHGFKRNLFTSSPDISSNGTSHTPSYSSSSKLLSSSHQQSQPNKVRYSRQHHSSLYPPFDNNHCSFAINHCPHPRAPNSRFCISHVDEGATLHFERCNYVKEDGMCLRYIPRSNLRSIQIFCEMHATIVANAKKKQHKQEKARIKLENDDILLTQLSNNVARTKGAIMETSSDEYEHFRVEKELVEDNYETLNDSSGSDSDDEDIDASKILTTAQQEDDDNTDVDDLQFGEHLMDDPSAINYDCLRNAGYFTVDEIAKIYQQKLLQKKQILLRLMEIDKLKFKHGWRQYNRQKLELKKQNINFTTDPKFISTSNLQGPMNIKSRAAFQNFIKDEIKINNETKAIMNHRVDRGPRALLRRQILKKRQRIFEADPDMRARHESKEEAIINSRPRYPTFACSAGSGGHAGLVRCTQTAMPLSRFCVTHIVQDPNQKLFKPCLFKYGPDPDDICQTPVLTELEKYGCPLHALPMPPKDPPHTLKENRKPKIEEEIDKIIMQENNEETSLSDNETEEEGSEDGEDENGDDYAEKELEHLVGDEVVDKNHFKETIMSIYTNGLYNTDSEESDDTESEGDERDDQPLTEQRT